MAGIRLPGFSLRPGEPFNSKSHRVKPNPLQAIVEAAEFYKHETGMSPSRFDEAVHAGFGPQGCANALLADLHWYYTHTQHVHQRVRARINKAIP